HAKEWEAAANLPRDVFQKMGKLGYLGLRYPKDAGGAGVDYWHTVCFAEELVRSRCSGLNLSLMVHTDMATPVIHRLGTPEQIDEFLKPAIAGEKIAAIGITEPDAGSDLKRLRTTARSDGSDYVINGAKMFTTNATEADFITLALRTGAAEKDALGSTSLMIFPTDTKGFRVEKKIQMIGNNVSGTSALVFDNCRIPKRMLLGRENRGFEYMMKDFQGERLIASINAVARSHQALDDAVRYGRERRAFDQPIGRFQTWRHEFADLYTQLEAARRLTYHACEIFNQGQIPVTEISMAKLFSCDLAVKIMDRCLQFHGGYGYTEEFDIAREWRDTRMMSIGFGTSEIMKELIASRLGLGIDPQGNPPE
ncbi:MAG: acyl-CoA dehydrogenase family protein, partial [Candidatus Lindowbacteria bacterium]|nr:acyl-CoA dehydrogenase family protein [Candidatus Lindowbacteria bacterium]